MTCAIRRIFLRPDAASIGEMTREIEIDKLVNAMSRIGIKLGRRGIRVVANAGEAASLPAFAMVTPRETLTAP